MKNLIRIEFTRLFKSKGLYISLFVGIIFGVCEYVAVALPKAKNIMNGFDGSSMTYPFSVYNSWLGIDSSNIFSSSFFYASMVLAALPYCAFFAVDNRNKYINQFYVRANRNYIHIAKFIVTFFSGGIALIIPMALNLYLTAVSLPALRPVQNGLFIMTGVSKMQDMFYTNPELFTFIYFVIIFAYGGAFVTVALVVSFYIDNWFLVTMSPFVLFYGLGIISKTLRGILGTPVINPAVLMLPSFGAAQGILPVILVPVIITVICFVFFMRKGDLNETI